MLPSRAAGAALLTAFAAACQPVQGPSAATPSAPTFAGALSATASRLEIVLATPSPFLASAVDATSGLVTRLVGRQGTRTFEIRIADRRPLTPGTTYGVGAPEGLDATGERTGAAISLVDGSRSWSSRSGSLTVSLVAGNEVACYFQGVAMTPSPDPGAGSFQVDGQVQAPLNATPTK
ncbi:MAG: hypothetical protein JWM80_1649 [Cyanobacteria bacterium RYN_339]|nr:hypothetical protein [Cyanobacteria bacterium RYN_339]